MSFWVRMYDVPPTTFLIPNKIPNNQQLVGFHLSLSMGYINSAPYLCMVIEKVANLSNETIAQRNVAGKHLLEEAADAKAADDIGASQAQDCAIWE